MALLQPRLNLKLAQKQVLTPGLVQMVSVLALNKLELREMINAEIVENPVLEEMDDSVPILDDVASGEDQQASATETTPEKDPFDEIDFGTYFQDYFDPGFRTPNSFEISEKPSFENFLSRATTLTDHLMWQLGSHNVSLPIRAAAELVIGNLNEDGYLTASDEELLASLEPELVQYAQNGTPMDATAALTAALQLIRLLDPPGTAARDLKDCLLAQIAAARLLIQGPDAEADAAELDAPLSPQLQLLEDAAAIAREHLALLQKRDMRDLSRALHRPPDAAQRAADFIRTLDPRPGRRYNREEARLIEPDVAIVKRGDEYISLMNEEDMPALRLNQGYRRLLAEESTEREVKDYVKDRYKSAIQLLRNIEQRKSTILRVCDCIVRRQYDFLESGVEALKPMMIKDVAEEIGVHPSTVSRAVSSKYVHTPQGVFELRFFFSEGANGPEGTGTPLMLLKRKVKKIIEDEDASHPLTDDQIAQMLHEQGIAVTRRTVAKYREDLHIPSTHQRRVRQ
jgi:RNA polymerase sigma-54 factor